MDSPPPSLSSSLPVSLSLSLMCAHRHLCLFLYCLLLVYTPLMVPGCTFNDQNKSKRHFHIYMSSIVFVYLHGAMKHACAVPGVLFIIWFLHLQNGAILL